MASSTMAFAPHQPPPLTRPTSPFKDPRTPPCCPCTPGKTAELWDEYERRAVENARRREPKDTKNPFKPSHSQRHSSVAVHDTVKSSNKRSSRRERTIKFGFGNTFDIAPATTLAICKSCKQPIHSTTGICERCKKTIVLQSPMGENAPPLTRAARNFASTDLPQLHKKSSSAGFVNPTSSSPKRQGQARSSTQPPDPPIRMSSLKSPPNTPEPVEADEISSGLRKLSLTDPNEPFLRLQISRKSSNHPPFSPPPTPTTPPSASQSRASTRPSSLANITTPPSMQHSSSIYTRHDSATPSELSTLYPYFSGTPTNSPASAGGGGNYNLQNATSAWDDWDTDEEEEKLGLVGYWKGMSIGKGKGKKWRSSRGSEQNVVEIAKSVRKDSESVKREEPPKVEVRHKKRPSGFVRAISCGCVED